MNLISQHIREGEKEFDFYHSRFNSQNEQYCNLGPDGVEKLKSFLRSSSLSLVEKIIGEVRGRKTKWKWEIIDGYHDEKIMICDICQWMKDDEESSHKCETKNNTIESVALLLEQGLEEVKDNK